jgi:molybdopterin molybdotransferase
VHLIGRQGSHILTSLTEADGVVVIPEERQLVEEGQPVLYASFADLGVPL